MERPAIAESDESDYSEFSDTEEVKKAVETETKYRALETEVMDWLEVRSDSSYQEPKK